MIKYLVILSAVLTSVTCKIVTHKIVGGFDAENGEFPYQVSIRDRGDHECGGAILNEHWILTAAHCISTKLASRLTVVVGTNYLDHGGEIYNISRVVSHIGFNVLTRKDDIGLLKVEKSIVFSPLVQPIKLPTRNTILTKYVTLTGWGRLNVNEDLSNTLQKIELKSILNTMCALLHKPKLIWLTNLCTLTKKGEGACYGDSGGPLVYKGEVIGVVSWSTPCATGIPDVFTRVYSYLNWIKLYIRF